MCPMYTLVLEELERQYRSSHSDLFKDDNQCLEDVIMNEQAKEVAAESHDTEREKDQNSWVSGRLTRQLNKAEEEVKRAKRVEATRLEGVPVDEEEMRRWS